jgi:hypothetical protein
MSPMLKTTKEGKEGTKSYREQILFCFILALTTFETAFFKRLKYFRMLQ